jgi:hypothetical protein
VIVVNPTPEVIVVNPTPIVITPAPVVTPTPIVITPGPSPTPIIITPKPVVTPTPIVITTERIVYRGGGQTIVYVTPNPDTLPTPEIVYVTPSPTPAPVDTVSVSVAKIWDDNNNEAGMRPDSIAVTLSNGTTVYLSASNGWSATVSNLPATAADGTPITYTWREQQVLGYTQTGMSVSGNTTVFTNSYRKPTTTPTIEVDYEKPLGIEVIINHVGDCFD